MFTLLEPNWAGVQKRMKTTWLLWRHTWVHSEKLGAGYCLCRRERLMTVDGGFKWTQEQLFTLRFVPCWRAWQIWIQSRAGGDPPPPIQIVQEAGIQECALNSTHSHSHGHSALHRGWVYVSCWHYSLHYRFIYTVCPPFLSIMDTYWWSKGRTHPTVRWTNYKVTIFKLIVFEAGNCINQAWHLFYYSLVSRAWLTPWPRDE